MIQRLIAVLFTAALLAGCQRERSITRFTLTFTESGLPELHVESAGWWSYGNNGMTFDGKAGPSPLKIECVISGSASWAENADSDEVTIHYAWSGSSEAELMLIGMTYQKGMVEERDARIVVPLKPGTSDALIACRVLYSYKWRRSGEPGATDNPGDAQ